MRLQKRFLVAMIITSMSILSGCTTKEVSVTPIETMMPTPVATQTIEETNKPEATPVVEQVNQESAIDSILTIDDYTEEALKGKYYTTYIPKGWVRGEDLPLATDIMTAYSIKREKDGHVINIREINMKEAEQIELGNYLSDVKDNYNAVSETSGIVVNEAGARELVNVNVGYMELEAVLTEAIVTAAINTGTIKQSEVDEAGGTQGYIEAQHEKRLQIYVPHYNEMIVIETLLGNAEDEEEIRTMAYALADIMILRFE